MPIVHDQDGLLIETSTTGSGTGNYDSFLRVQSNNEESGYNTDVNGQLDNKDGIWTHSLFIGSLVVVNIGGTDYYEIRLDLNEVQSGDKPFITLEELQLWVGDPAGADAYPSFTGLTNVFDLDGSVLLQDTNHGSGTDDYVIRIPVSMLTGGDYLTLYAEFSGSDDGFEEFRALTQEFIPQPDIGVLKETNGTDDECPNILVGQTVTWTYTVENNGNLALSNVVVTDDNGTPLDDTDDFTATYVSGDTNLNGLLDTNETWIFEASGTAHAGEYENIATVSGDWAFGGNSGTVTGIEEDCYFGADPSVGIVKMTNGTDDLCPVIAVGDTVTWTYFISNTGNVGLTNIIVSDDNGTPGNTGDDFFANPVLSGGFNVGDLNQDNILDLTEVWEFSYSGTAVAGHYDNIATVTADFSDDVGNSTTVNATEDDCYVGVEGPGVRTPGFWQNPNNGGQFWDGVTGNEKNAGADCFPLGELLYLVQSTEGGPANTVGLLIGDYNKNGIQDAGEDVIFISLADAQSLINASNKQMSDGVIKIGRDLVATWLNYLAGNPIGTVADDGLYSPMEVINDAIDYLQIFGDSNNNGGGNADTNDVFDTYSSSHRAVRTNSDFWSDDFPGGNVSGSEIHNALDEYNNFGTVDGWLYAHDCDEQQLLTQLSGFSHHGDLYVM